MGLNSAFKGLKMNGNTSLLSLCTFVAFYKSGFLKNLPVNNGVFSCSGKRTAEQ